MQLTRLRIFNPKLPINKYLKNINSEKLLNTKTSTWINEGLNEILIISHIPKQIIKTPIFKIIAYPDKNQNILTENAYNNYYFHSDTLYNIENKKIDKN